VKPVREALIMGSPIVHFELIGKAAAQLKAFYTGSSTGRLVT